MCQGCASWCVCLSPCSLPWCPAFIHGVSYRLDDHSRTAGTYPGTKRRLWELEILSLVHGQHDFAVVPTWRSVFSLPRSVISQISGAGQLPGDGADALLLLGRCVTPPSALQPEFGFGRHAQANSIRLRFYVS